MTYFFQDAIYHLQKLYFFLAYIGTLALQRILIKQRIISCIQLFDNLLCIRSSTQLRIRSTAMNLQLSQLN